MNALAPSLIVASATIILLLGLIHLVYTFSGTKLHPRDAALQARLKEVSPILTRETTMWKAWIGVLSTALYVAALIVVWAS